MKIEQLKALSKEEINELCATKVMKWKIIKEYFPDKSYYKIYYDGEKRLGNVDSYGFYPSEDMDDAMIVSNAMNDCLHLKQHGKEGTWEASFCGSGHESISADTACLAIVYAAILAVGGE